LPWSTCAIIAMLRILSMESCNGWNPVTVPGSAGSRPALQLKRSVICSRVSFRQPNEHALAHLLRQGNLRNWPENKTGPPKPPRLTQTLTQNTRCDNKIWDRVFFGIHEFTCEGNFFSRRQRLGGGDHAVPKVQTITQRGLSFRLPAVVGASEDGEGSRPFRRRHSN
jgi:hypothetical protein